MTEYQQYLLKSLLNSEAATHPFVVSVKDRECLSEKQSNVLASIWSCEQYSQMQRDKQVDVETKTTANNPPEYWYFVLGCLFGYILKTGLLALDLV